MFPIIGSRKSEKLNDLNNQAKIEYQKDMSIKLEEWEIDNGCKVIASLIEENYVDVKITKSVIGFYKLSNDELNDYKKQRNERNTN
ncbi:MAG: hypothetical protein WC917_00830 [Bacilli bacterium]|jgi:hypothetical protein